MGIFPLHPGFGGTILTKEWVLHLAAVGAEGSILPEGGVFGGPMEGGGGEPEAESSAVTESSAERMGVEVGQGDHTTPPLPEAALPVRREAKVQSMKRFPSAADSVAPKPAVRPMRVIWPLLTRRPHHPRRGYSPRCPWLPPHQGPPLHPPQLASPLRGVDESSRHEGCRLAGAVGEGGPLPLFAQAGALQPSPWLPRNLQQVLCRQTRSL